MADIDYDDLVRRLLPHPQTRDDNSVSVRAKLLREAVTAINQLRLGLPAAISVDHTTEQGRARLQAERRWKDK